MFISPLETKSVFFKLMEYKRKISGQGFFFKAVLRQARATLTVRGVQTTRVLNHVT